ncbi:SDR family NAD(P)-dependent oxidoreductase [Pseudarthrobacter sp. BRE9]|uniref:SDR family NAD(P)-dependent oxidoreductase n=1 Tax=Pseudarthrobacter sp. BRE9 TaxID=2962582 RepID=UPI002881F304|nr:SDR family NAD(P)-dependent oxidoreductase [Pseudarthrobacter sp. BRE9]MDT0168384.1 SDR family NAD(P)-dependent oxidoreductase [Pseudarthrobacter sp. BRE9]
MRLTSSPLGREGRRHRPHALLERRSQRSNEAAGSKAVVGLKHNIVTESDCVDCVPKAAEASGKVDTLINTGQTRDVWDIDPDETIRILNVNILGTPLGGCDAEMKKNGTGWIVKILSAAGLVGNVSGGPAAFSSTKDARPARSRRRSRWTLPRPTSA